MKRRISALLSGLVLACQPATDQSPHLSDYLREVHRIESAQGLRFCVFLPQNGCPSCLKQTLVWLESHELGTSSVVVLAGLNRAELIPVRQRLNRHRLLLDVGYHYLSYRLPASGTPFYAVLSERQPPEFHEINAANADEELRNLEKLVARL